MTSHETNNIASLTNQDFMESKGILAACKNTFKRTAEYLRQRWLKEKHSTNPSLPNTLWRGIWTPKTHLKHQTSGGIWKTREMLHIVLCRFEATKEEKFLKNHIPRCSFLHKVYPTFIFENNILNIPICTSIVESKSCFFLFFRGSFGAWHDSVVGPFQKIDSFFSYVWI